MLRILFLGSLVLVLAQQLPAQFQPHLDSATGTGPYAVAVSDFNKDGKPDLAVTNNTDNTVSVLLGNGDGTFQPHVDYATGTRPVSLVVGDFNGDGTPDLAITNGTSSTVSVLLGKGDGTFQPHVDYATDLNPQWLDVADFNGDGKLDVATANYGPDYSPGTVSVFLGNGDGTLQPERSYPAGTNPFGVMAGDFNRDGKPDLAVTNNNGSFGVWILLGNGDGSFQPPVFYATGQNPRVGVVADFNADGFLDLAIANTIENNLSILLGDGDGHFSTPVNYSAGAFINKLAGGDFDGDGKLDLVTANTGSDSVSVLMGNGDGTFQAHVDFAAGSAPAWVAVADFNDDGAPDLVTANINGNSVSVLLNDLRTTTTTLTSSLNPADLNQVVTYTATVTNRYGREVTGNVVFEDAAVMLGTETLNASGIATYTSSTLAPGQHSITAVYGGDTNNAGSASAALIETINSPPDFALSSSPASVTVVAGKPATFTVTVTPQGPFTNAISFSCSGLPALAGCTFTPATLTPNTSVVSTTLAISTGARAVAAERPQMGHRSSPLYALWLAVPGLVLGMVGLATPARRKVLTRTLLCLVAASCLLQVVCGGNSSSPGGGGSSGTPVGTYTVTVTGTADSAQHVTTVTFTVQ